MIRSPGSTVRQQTATLSAGVNRIAATLIMLLLATGSAAAAMPRYNYAPAPNDVLDRVRALESVAERHGVSLAAAALAFVLAHPQVASVIPGLANPQQVADTIGLYREPIPQEFWNELRHAGLVRPDAPLPGVA